MATSTVATPATSRSAAVVVTLGFAATVFDGYDLIAKGDQAL